MPSLIKRALLGSALASAFVFPALAQVAGNPVELYSNGIKVGTAANPLVVSGGGGGGGGGGAVTAVAGAFVDGAVTTIGTEADAAFTGTGSATEIAILKGLYAEEAIQATAANQSTQITQETKSATGIGTPTDAVASAPTSASSASMIALQKLIANELNSYLAGAFATQATVPGTGGLVADGVYTATAPTLTTGQASQLQLSVHAALVTSDSNLTSAIVAPNSTAGAKSVQSGLVYNSTPPTLTSGSQSPLQGDSASDLLVSMPTAVVAATAGPAPIASTALEASHILKASAGLLYGVYVSDASAAGYLMVFNATTAPADGAVTPAECVPAAIQPSGSIAISYPTFPEYFSTGITAVYSTGANCFTKLTTAATAFIHGNVK